MSITVRLGAKSCQWISLKQSFVFEVIQLIEDFWLISHENLFQLSCAYFLATLVREANDLVELVVGDLLS